MIKIVHYGSTVPGSRVQGIRRVIGQSWKVRGLRFTHAGNHVYMNRSSLLQLVKLQNVRRFALEDSSAVTV